MIGEVEEDFEETISRDCSPRLEQEDEPDSLAVAKVDACKGLEVLKRTS